MFTRSSRTTEKSPTHHGTTSPTPAHVVDAAFADLPNLLERIDQGVPTKLRQKHVAETQQLCARIAQQMQSLEAQRDRLMRLLDDLNLHS